MFRVGDLVRLNEKILAFTTNINWRNAIGLIVALKKNDTICRVKWWGFIGHVLQSPLNFEESLEDLSLIS